MIGLNNYLAAICLQGVYGVVLNITSIDEAISYQERRKIAVNIAAGKAIQDLSSEFVQYLQKFRTDDKQKQIVSWLEQQIKGSLEFDTAASFSEIVDDNSKVLFIITLKVHPFQPKFKLFQTANTAVIGSILLNNLDLDELNKYNFLQDRKEDVISKLADLMKASNIFNNINENTNFNLVSSSIDKYNVISQGKKLLNSNFLNSLKRFKAILKVIGARFNHKNYTESFNAGKTILKNNILDAKHDILILQSLIMHLAPSFQIPQIYNNQIKSYTDNIQIRLDVFNKNDTVPVFDKYQTINLLNFPDLFNHNLFAKRKISNLWLFIVNNPEDSNAKTDLLGRYNYNVFLEDSLDLLRNNDSLNRNKRLQKYTNFDKYLIFDNNTFNSKDLNKFDSNLHYNNIQILNKSLIQVNFKSPESGAHVNINRKYIGKTPLTYSFRPGSYLLKAKQEDYKTYREKMVLDSLGPINKNLPLIKLTRKLFIGLKLGSTLADAQILANSNSILSPYATYYDNPKNIKIFTPNPKLFGYIGVSIEYFTSLKKRLAFQFEANYTALGAYYNNNPSLIINQLRFPLTIKYFVVKRYVAFTANASYNFNLNASYGNTNVLPLIQKQNYSFGGGLEINFVRSVYFGANYNIEQIPLLIDDKSNNKSYKNKTDLLILFIGVRL